MKNIVELRNELSELYSNLKAGATDPHIAKELNNAAGKMIGTLKVQLIYAELRDEKPSIPFLNEESPEASQQTKSKRP